MNKKFFAVGLVVLFCVCPVMIARAASWEGFYAGGHVGGAIGSPEMKSSTVFSPTGYFAQGNISAITSTGDQKNSQGNISYAIEGGYNFDLTDVVVGVQADFGSTNLNVSTQGKAEYPNNAGTTIFVNQQVTASWTASVLPRVGVDLGGYMVYGTAGLSFTNLHYVSFFQDNYAAAYDQGSIDTIALGITGGAGAEFKINDNVSVAGEYLYSSYPGLSAANTGLTANVIPFKFPTNVFTDTINLVNHAFHMAIHFHL